MDRRFEFWKKPRADPTFWFEIHPFACFLLYITVWISNSIKMWKRKKLLRYLSKTTTKQQQQEKQKKKYATVVLPLPKPAAAAEEALEHSAERSVQMQTLVTVKAVSVEDIDIQQQPDEQPVLRLERKAAEPKVNKETTTAASIIQDCQPFLSAAAVAASQNIDWLFSNQEAEASRTKSILNGPMQSPSSPEQQQEEEPWACGMDPHFMEKSIQNDIGTPTAKTATSIHLDINGTPDTAPMDEELDAVMGIVSSSSRKRNRNRTKRRIKKQKNLGRNSKTTKALTEKEIVNQAFSDLSFGIVDSSEATTNLPKNRRLQDGSPKQAKTYEHVIKELFCYSV